MESCSRCDRVHAQYMATHGAHHERRGLLYCPICRSHFDPSAPHAGTLSCVAFTHRADCGECRFLHRVRVALAAHGIKLTRIAYLGGQHGHVVHTEKDGTEKVAITLPLEPRKGQHHQEHHDNIVAAAKEAHK